MNESWRAHAGAKGAEDSGVEVGQNYLSIYDRAREKAGSSRATEAAAGIRGVLLGELPNFAIEYSHPALEPAQWFRILVTPIKPSRVRDTMIAMVVHVDVSDQKILELNLRKQEERYLSLLNSAQEGIFALEERGVCTFCNRAGARLFGYEEPSELVGRVVHLRHHYNRPDRRGQSFSESKIGQAILSGKVLHADDESFFRVDGTHFPVEFWCHPIYCNFDIVGTVVTFFDITEGLQLRSEFLHAQKLEAVGRLTGGMAHDFKNALAVIAGYSQLLGDRLVADEDGRRYAQQISSAAERAASFTRQLLGLNRKESPNPVSLDLNSVVTSLEEMLRRMIGEHITLTVTLAPKLPLTQADPGQMEQVLINLIANARDAMPQGGELVIRTSSVNSDGYVTLSVSDNGCGMDRATQDRIFEPFFTTKGPGKGTGLGLSTVRKIIKQCGGHIFVDSEPGVGSSFQIYLPIAAGVLGPMLLSQPPERDLRGSETILVVEDEEAFRVLVSDALRANGYKVLEAKDGASGIEIAQQSADRIDLVLTDVVLPDINGGRVAERLLESNRFMEVLYMSGYTDQYIASLGIDVHETTLLEKPFDLKVMLMTVRKALDRMLPSARVADVDGNDFLTA